MKDCPICKGCGFTPQGNICPCIGQKDKENDIKGSDIPDFLKDIF
jgi:hypothetical protein